MADKKITTIAGYNVAATLRTAFIYERISGGHDYFSDLIDMESASNSGSETSGMKINAITIINLFYSLIITYDPSKENEKFFNELLDSVPLGELQNSMADIMSMVFDNVSEESDESIPPETSKEGTKKSTEKN